MIKISSAIFKTFFLSLCIVANIHFAFAQTASILPQGYTQYLDSNGKPLSAGKVYNYIPSTTTPKTTWQDAAETIPNANPVILDAAGRAKILGDGSYRQIVKDRNNVTIWDAVTSSTGSGSTSPTATGDGDLVGTIKPWAGMTAPNQYAFAYGQEVSRTTYSALYTAITSSQSVFCNSGSPILNGLSDTTNFWIGMSVEVSCVAAGFSTIVSKTASTVVLADNANVTTNPTAIFYPWGRGNGTTTFNLPDLRGVVPAGNNNMGGVASANLTTTYFGSTDPNSIGALGGNQSKTLIAVNIPGHSHPVFLNDPGHTHVIFNPGSFGGNATGAAGLAGLNTGVGSTSTLSSTTGTTIRNTSGGFGTINQTNYTGGGIAVSATLGNTGSGYTNGAQTITITGGTCTTQPQFTVTVAGNVFTGTPALLTAGSCTVAPTNPAATTGGGGTGGTLNVVYSAQPFSLIPPTRTTNFIIKITPDTNSATASGVTSLGSMTGDIACGSGLLCTGNNVSVNSSSLTYIAPYAGSVTQTITNKLAQTINIKDFGAVCDGATDDTTAINTADAAAAAAGKALYFPAGTCIAEGLNLKRNNLEWFGDGPYLSVIKAKSGSAFDTLAWFGERTATAQYANNYVHDIGFDGNGTGTNSVVEIRNIQHSTFENIQITNGLAQGLTTETSGVTINTNLLRNNYLNIRSFSNAGKGFYFRGEKDSKFIGLFAHNNTGDGIYFGPANLNSSALCETTEVYGAALSSRDNGGDGFVFDEVEKYVLSSLLSAINGGYGIRFRSSITGCTSTGSNSVQIANFASRNDAMGAIRAADNSYVYGASFGTVWVRGDSSTVSGAAIELDGVTNSQFGSVHVEAWPGTAMRIAQGNPLGSGTAQSNKLTFGEILLYNNGNSGAANNHGLTIENSSADIQIGTLNSANSQTAGSNYELIVGSSVGFVSIGSNLLSAGGGASNNYSISNSATYTSNGTTGTRTTIGGASGPSYSFASEPGLGFYRPTSGRVGFATGGSESVRFGNGLMVGTTTDPGAGVINVVTGFRIGNAATSGRVLRGDGTNFISAQLAASDLSNGTTGSGAAVLAGSPNFTAGITVNAASTFNIPSSNIFAFDFNVQAANSQVGFGFSDNGLSKWSIYKNTDHTLNYYDNTNGVTVATFTQGTSSTATYKVNATTASMSSTTGALQSAGGLGVAGAGWFGTYVNIVPTVVNSLPSCTAGIEGARAYVTDNNTAVAFNGAVTTGGSNKTPVFCDGSAWKQGALQPANDNIIFEGRKHA